MWTQIIFSSFFSIWLSFIFVFIFFLKVLVGTSYTMLHQSFKSGCFVSLLILQEAFLFHHEYYVGCELFIYALSYVEVVSCIPGLLRVFFHKRVLNFVKCINWDNLVDFFSHHSINVMYYIDFLMLKYPCMLRTNPTLSWCLILLMCSWILFASLFFFWGGPGGRWICASRFIRNIGL